jgi:hypothetical protein
MTTQPNDQGIRWIDAHLHLLDRQLHDAHRVPIAVIDDLELSNLLVGEEIPAGTPPPLITALLSRPVLGARIFRGRPPRSRSHSTPWIAIIDIGVVIKLAITGEATDLTWTERWVRDRMRWTSNNPSAKPGRDSLMLCDTYRARSGSASSLLADLGHRLPVQASTSTR